jgi:hypothetical protein
VGNHKIGLAKNKVEKSGVFLAANLSHAFCPQKPCISPRFHHKITIKKHAHLQDPLQKCL